MLRHLLMLPRARWWVAQTIAAHERHARIMDARVSRSLCKVVSPGVLNRVRMVAVDRLPQPPLERWGIGGGLRPANAAGVTLNQMIFVRRGLERDESLLFHELVHVVQWRTLGMNRFLAMYGLLMLESGYRDNPLEAMAYALQSRFDATAFTGDMMPIVARRTQELFDSFRRRTLLHRLIFLAV